MIGTILASARRRAKAIIIGYIGANTGTFTTQSTFASMQWNYNTSGSNGQSVAAGNNVEITVYTAAAFSSVYFVAGTPSGGTGITITSVDGPYSLVNGLNVIQTGLDVTATGQYIGIASSSTDGGKNLGKITALNSNISYCYLNGITPFLYPPLVGSTYNTSGNLATGALIAITGGV